MNHRAHTLMQFHTHYTHTHTTTQHISAECGEDVASVGCFISMPPLLSRNWIFFMCGYMRKVHVYACACDWEENVADCLVRAQRAPLCN